MKTLVVYYTRSGNTTKVAEEIATALGADIELLKDNVNRGGPVGFLKSGSEAKSGKMVNLEPLKHDPASYDIVVVGTPVWARMVSSPINTFLRTSNLGNAKLAWFCTVGASNDGFKENCFTSMGEAASRTPVATVGFSAKEVKNDHSKAIADFADTLKATVAQG